MSTNVCQRDVFINSYKLTKIIKWKKVINTEITSGHFGRKKKRARSQSTSVNYYIRFLKTDKVRPNKKQQRENTCIPKIKSDLYRIYAQTREKRRKQNIQYSYPIIIFQRLSINMLCPLLKTEEMEFKVFDDHELTSFFQ